MMGLIFVVVVLVATIALAILGSKVWHWAHVLVVVGLVLSTIGYSNLGYRVLQYRAKHQSAEKKSLDQLQKENELLDAIVYGTEESGQVRRLSEALGLAEDAESISSIGQIEYELRLVNRVRGRLWENVLAMGAPDNTGQLDVGVAETAPTFNVAMGSILYLFEQGDPSQEAAYLGEFRVVQSAPRQLRLEPVLSMHVDDQQRFINSAQQQKPWVLHETMPVDSSDLFAGLSEEQLRGMLPESVVEEYVRDGGETRPDDDPLRILGIDEDGKLVGPESLKPEHKRIYRRKLRDYAFLFQEFAKQRRELNAQIATSKLRNAKLQETVNGAKLTEAYRKKENLRLKTDKKGVLGDQQAAEDHLAALNQQLKRARDLLTKTLAANVRTAEQFAMLQAALIGSPDLSTQPAGAKSAGDRHAL